MLRYSIIACILSIVLISAFFNSEALAEPVLYLNSPTVALNEDLYLVLSDPDHELGTSGFIPAKVLAQDTSVVPHLPKFITSVTLVEIGNTGNYVSEMVKFTENPIVGAPQVEAHVGYGTWGWIPGSSPLVHVISGEVVVAVDLTQEYEDMKFNPIYSDCFADLDEDGVLDFGGDDDGDGICHDWEPGGNELIVSYLDSAKPYVYDCGFCDDDIKDIFVELDYMQGHRLGQLAIDNVIDAFANSGVDDGLGIRLHVQVDDPDSEFIPHKYNTIFPGKDNGAFKQGFDQIKSKYFGTEIERMAEGEDHWIEIGWDQKRQAFHYLLSTHFRTGSTSSGIAEVLGNDMMVSLGAFHGNIGNVEDQSGSFMHELGHNLELSHGGFNDDVNCKPNYLSVMSYSRQFDYFDLDRELDYSKEKLGTMVPDEGPINENALDENAGIGRYQENTEQIIFNAIGDTTEFSPVGEACVNWDPNTTCGTPIDEDHDLRAIKDSTGVFLCPPATTTALEPMEDWNMLSYSSRGFGGYDDGAPGPGGSRIPESKCLEFKAERSSHVPPGVSLKTRSCDEGVEDGVKTASQGNREMNYEDVQTMRVIQIDLIESFVKNLPDSSFENNDKKGAITQLNNEFVNARNEIRNDDLFATVDVLIDLSNIIDKKLTSHGKDIAKEKVKNAIDSHAKALQIADPAYVPLPSPNSQKGKGIPLNEIQCNRGLSLFVNSNDKEAICVYELTGNYLQKRENWKEYEFPSLKNNLKLQITK